MAVGKVKMETRASLDQENKKTRHVISVGPWPLLTKNYYLRKGYSTDNNPVRTRSKCRRLKMRGRWLEINFPSFFKMGEVNHTFQIFFQADNYRTLETNSPKKNCPQFPPRGEFFPKKSSREREEQKFEKFTYSRLEEKGKLVNRKRKSARLLLFPLSAQVCPGCGNCFSGSPAWLLLGWIGARPVKTLHFSRRLFCQRRKKTLFPKKGEN